MTYIFIEKYPHRQRFGKHPLGSKGEESKIKSECRCEEDTLQLMFCYVEYFHIFYEPF